MGAKDICIGSIQETPILTISNVVLFIDHPYLIIQWKGSVNQY